MSTPEERLREQIDARGVSGLARSLGVARNTLYNWCSKGNVPLDQLFALGEAGVDVAYVLTGTDAVTRQALGNLRAATDAAMASGGTREEKNALQEAEFHRLQGPRFGDLDRLAAAISAVEEGLAETRRKLPPAKRAELIFAAYQLMAEPEQSRDNVIALVRSAA